MAKSELGTKRICPTTGKKFYDLNKNSGDLALYRRSGADRARGAAARATRGAEAPLPRPRRRHHAGAGRGRGLVSLEEADAEENTGKVKAAVPESEDDIEVDETIEDDETMIRPSSPTTKRATRT